VTRKRPICPHCKRAMESYREIIVGGRTVVEVEYLDGLAAGDVRESVVELVDADAGPEKPTFEYQCGNCGEWLDGKPEMTVSQDVAA
jgi:hypothetical protein